MATIHPQKQFAERFDLFLAHRLPFTSRTISNAQKFPNSFITKPGPKMRVRKIFLLIKPIFRIENAGIYCLTQHSQAMVKALYGRVSISDRFRDLSKRNFVLFMNSRDVFRFGY